MSQFLVIDHNADGRTLLTRTLRRKFPNAELVECGAADQATTTLQGGGFDAVVVHRTEEVDGEMLVRLLRRVNPTVPIVAVSGIDRSEKLLAAGASEFLNYDEWLRLGTVVAKHLPNPDP